MKEALRKKYFELRNRLTKEDIILKSEEIKKKIFSLKEFREAKKVNCYISKDSEVFTHSIIKEVLRMDKVLTVPYVCGDVLRTSVLYAFDDLRTGSFNVLEPTTKQVSDTTPLDIVIVPGIAFDLRGNRTGYGKGYYDKFLSNNNALKIGLCFDFQIVDSINAKEHDIPMDVIVTEKKIMRLR